MPQFSATYSAEDNKLRLYSTRRLDREIYDRVKAAGFSWAPKQELFVAPRWTPEREDLLLDLAGQTDDEETPRAERAAERAERFEVYSDKRGAEAESARAHVERIAGPIHAGQVIVVGRQSARRAEREAEKIKSGMATAVRLKDTAKYWEHRAERVTRHAAYKADPGLRARRIKTLEAEERGHRRDLDFATTALDLWTKVSTLEDAAVQHAAALALANDGRMAFGLWSEIKDGKIAAAEACARTIQRFQDRIEDANRWIAHVNNRLAYERILLGRGANEKTAMKPRKVLPPILNYRAESIDGRDRYGHHNHNGAPVPHAQVAMTAAEFAKIHDEYKGTGLSFDGTHRFRFAMVRAEGSERRKGVAVFITDTKTHPRPAPVVKEEVEEVEEEVEDDAPPAPPAPIAPALVAPRAVAAPPPVDPFEAMRSALRLGVQAVAVPELFVTPAPLAKRVADEADIFAGARVCEPSAGLAALALAARARGAVVVCVDNARAMVDALERAGFTAHLADFLDVTPDMLGGLFDRVLMNPPFSVEIEHVLHAWTFLKPGGRLVAIMSAGVAHRPDKKTAAFRDFVDEHGTMEPLPDGSFAASGTNVSTVLVVLDKPWFVVSA